ncbi:MAG: tetratricopeptide repeat protein [Ignavibacteriae bacterium]|nr:tetratricopeptide repeat protein [Ignavibacteriota bacterium]
MKTYFFGGTMTHEQINNHLTKADTESRRGNYDTAEQYISTILETLEESQLLEQSQVFRLRALLLLAQTMWRRSDYNQVLAYANQAISVADKLSDTHKEKEPTLTKIYNVIGLTYWNLSNYSLSLEYYSKAMELGEKTGDKIGVAVVLGNMGIVYSNLADYSRALEYFGNALIAHEELGMKAEAANVTCNIGVIYRTLGDYSRAFEYFSASLAAFKELGNKAEIARVTGNIGNVFSLSSNFQQALEYYKTALVSHEYLGNKADTAIILGYIGHLYAEKSFEEYDPNKAKKYLLDAIAIDEKVGTKADLYENHRIIAKLFKDEKNWEKFAEHFEKYHDLEREVHNDDAKKQAQRFAIERDIAAMQPLSKRTRNL